VVADANVSVRHKEIPLRVDVNENLPPLCPYHLKYHPNDFLSGHQRFLRIQEYALTHKRVHIPISRVPFKDTLVTLVSKMS
jgi:hypothetical protein